MEIKEIGSQYLEQIKEIYAKENWNAYLRDDEKLKRAFDNSLLTLGAFHNDILVGFVRCVGDGEHVLVVQDLIVDPSYQKKGIGTTLFQTVWNRYKDVRFFQVVTDIEDGVDDHFYRSKGMRPIADGHMIAYFRT